MHSIVCARAHAQQPPNSPCEMIKCIKKMTTSNENHMKFSAIRMVIMGKWAFTDDEV